MTSAQLPVKPGGGLSSNPGQKDNLTNFSPIITRYIQDLHQSIATAHNWGRGRDAISTFMLEFPSLPSHLQTPLSNGRLSTFEAMMQYLASPNSSWQEPFAANDLTRPLPEYFISTSHNTYLTGNQLSSEASIGAYQDVLLRGCRSVEVDVWDGKSADNGDEEETGSEHRGLRERLGLKFLKSHSERDEAQDAGHGEGEPRSVALQRGEPRVLHGHTLTTEISFRAVCRVIRESAFVNSNLPVIVSLEVHTNYEQQQEMVNIMNEEWGDLLLQNLSAQRLAAIETQQLPAPAHLLNKILIKVKYTPPEVAKKKKLQDIKHDDPSDSSDDEDATDKPAKKPKISPVLGQLGVYMRGCHFKSFYQPEAKIPTHVFSVSEKSLIEINSTLGDALLTHNRDFLMRAYPKGMRFTSSNMNPSLFWRQGVQMAALNWQECDKGVMLNQAMFAGTGGYVLKPAAYRHPARVSDIIKMQNHVGHVASTANLLPSLKLLDFSIEIFAAQDIPLCPGMGARKFRPYITCTLHVDTIQTRPSKESSVKQFFHKHDRSSNPAEDDETGHLKVRSYTHEGQSPDFKGEMLKFSSVAVDEEALSFVRIKVNDDVELGRNELAAWACVRLDRLGEGLRTIRLIDANGQPSAGVLLVRVGKKMVRGGQGQTLMLPLR